MIKTISKKKKGKMVVKGGLTVKAMKRREEKGEGEKEFSDSLVAAAAAKSLQSCPTLCSPTDGSPPGSPIPGIFQARTLEWVAISFSNA